MEQEVNRGIPKTMVSQNTRRHRPPPSANGRTWMLQRVVPPFQNYRDEPVPLLWRPELDAVYFLHMAQVEYCTEEHKR